jgi:outer membrane protein OmpA-like peptidoglycan-associated protein
MKTLIIGFLVFLGWSAWAANFYVCKIKGLCNETGIAQNAAVDNKDSIGTDTLSRSPLPAPILPGALSIYFDFDKYEFIPDAMTDKYIVESNAYLDQNSQAVFFIVGYTDAIGSDKYNQALGDRRARGLQNYLLSKGIPANKSVIESKGEKDPAGDNNTSDGRAKNRRTVITIK